MARLIVGGLPEWIVRALAHCAAKRKRTVEQEHREILRAALVGPRKVHLAGVIDAIPNVGRDEDFARSQ